METATVGLAQIQVLSKVMKEVAAGLHIDDTVQTSGHWKDDGHRDAVKKELQGLVDAVVHELLPPWVVSTKKGPKIKGQLKVQACQVSMMNGQLRLPFLTFAQQAVLRGFKEGDRIEVVPEDKLYDSGRTANFVVGVTS